MQDIYGNYKILTLIAPVVQTSTTTGSGVDVEIYGEDAMALVEMGTMSGGSPSTVVTIQGSLPGTPTTYDQTLATFTAATAAGTGAADINLSGIKNVRAVATQTGAGNVPVAVQILCQSRTASATLNSVTLA